MIDYEVMSNEALDEKMHKVLNPLSDGTLAENYTGDWAVMGPIIQDKGITVDGNGVAWSVDLFDTYQHFTRCFKNPLRAAAIVFLKMDS